MLIGSEESCSHSNFVRETVSWGVSIPPFRVDAQTEANANPECATHPATFSAHSHTSCVIPHTFFASHVEEEGVREGEGFSVLAEVSIFWMMRAENLSLSVPS